MASTGIHTRVMAGTFLVALKTYAGVDVRDGKLNINPHLPKHRRSIKFNNELQENHFAIEALQNEVQVKFEGDNEKVKFWVNGEMKEVERGAEIQIKI